MTLEMKRVLEEYIGGGRNYRRMFDASYEEIYCRSFLILQQENQAREFMKDFFAELFMVLDEATDASDAEFWFWEKYYGKIRKQYHRLLEAQIKIPEIGAPALAQILVGLPLLHRIMLLMSYHDGFKTEDIANMFGLAADKVQIELDKLEKMRPSLVKNQPEEISPYLGDWKVLLLGACNQLASATNNDWIEQLYQDSLNLAGLPSTIQIPVEEIRKRTLESEKVLEEIPVQQLTAPKKAEPQPQPEFQVEPEEEVYQPVYEQEEESYVPTDGVYEDPVDEEPVEEDEESTEWGGEESNWKMIVFGIILALLIVAVVGVAAWKLLDKDDTSNKKPTQTEETKDDDDSAGLIIKGDEEEEGDDVVAEEPVEEDPVEEEPEEEEPLMMKVKGTDSRVNVRSERSTNGDIITKVVSGEKVEVLGDPETEEWVLVHCTEQNDKEGYIKTEFLSYIQ